MNLKSLPSRRPGLDANASVLWSGSQACFSARTSCRPSLPMSMPIQVLSGAISPLLAISIPGLSQGILCLADPIADRESPSTITDFSRHSALDGLAHGVGMGTYADQVRRSSRHPGDVRREMIVDLCNSHLLRVSLLGWLLTAPRWSIQFSCPNRSSTLPVTLLLPLQTRFLVRPQLLTRGYPLPMGRDIPRSLLVA
jgi:hypothetical protein